MEKRKNTHLNAVEGLLLSMRQDGMAFQEIVDEVGLSHKQLRNGSYRHKCENRNMLKAIAPRPKGRPEKGADLAREIQLCQDITDKTYGYRRIWLWLKRRDIHRYPKTIRRIMKKYGLLSEIRRRRKWGNLGQQVQKYKNLLARQFRADRPNAKWVTDISYLFYVSLVILAVGNSSRHTSRWASQSR